MVVRYRFGRYLNLCQILTFLLSGFPKSDEASPNKQLVYSLYCATWISTDLCVQEPGGLGGMSGNPFGISRPHVFRSLGL
jgi:hypothetical protein